MVSTSSGMNRSDDDHGHLDDIDEILRKPNLCDTLESLAPLAILTDPVIGMPYPMDTTDECDSSSPNLRKYVQLWQIAYFAMVALVKSNPYRRETITAEKLNDVLNHYKLYDAPFYEDFSGEEFLKTSIRMTFQQIPSQNAWYGGMNSAKYIYGTNTYINNMTTKIFGTEYDVILDICVYLYMAVYNQSEMKRTTSFTFKDISNLLAWHDPVILRKVIDTISQTQNEFRKKCKDTRGDNDELRKYDFNPLYFKPIIEINRRYYIPVPQMMILWATEGIKYHLSEYARFIGEDGTFFDKFGKTAFEGYVMHMLDVSKRQYIPEQEVIVGKNKELTADFILLEGDKALIMECKTRRGSLEHRYGIIEAIDADYEKTIIKGLHQCVCTEKLIRNGILDLSQYPELQGVSEFSYAVVTHDIFYQANSRLMQDRVREKMGEDIQYQVLSARELELILANIAKNGIIQFIAAKSVKSYLMPESYENYLRLWIDKRGDSNMNDPSQDICLALAERSRFYIEKMLRPTQQLPAFPF